MVFESILDDQVDAVCNVFVLFMMNVDQVHSTLPTGYCLEEQRGVPTANQLFSMANVAKQQEFSASRSILAAGL